MTFTEAAAQVLRLVGKPLHYKEITDVAIERDLLSHVGKSPEVTMGARLAALVKKGEKDNPLVRVKPGVFALREWDQKVIDSGLADRTPALALIANNPASDSAELAAEVPSVSSIPSPEPSQPPPYAADADQEVAIDEDEKTRAELREAASAIFEPEDDDDKPILATDEEDDEEDGERAESSNKRRRRRRRRRGGAERSDNDDGLPSYTVSDAPVVVVDDADAEEAERERPVEKSHPRRRGGDTSDQAALGVADAVARLLGGRRNAGMAPKQLADQAVRKGYVSDGSLSQSAVVAALRADNLRREGRGERPRFRLASGRVSLSDWGMDSSMERLEEDIQHGLKKYREATRKLLLKRIADLPQRALTELLLVVFERMGFSGLDTVRRQGAHASELHMSGTQSSSAGEFMTAIVVRRDGRDIGRERVSDLRGSLHHYGRAVAGLLVTSGQVLSGAREEAAVAGAAPVTLIDGTGLASRCEEAGIGVFPTRIDLPVIDQDFFDSLKG